MRFKSNAFRFVLSFCLIFCLCAAAFADTIRLKDGSVIKGKIIGFRDGQFLVQIGEGARSRQMTFFADEIDTIEFDSSAPASTPISANSSGSYLPKPANGTISNPQTTGNVDNSKTVNQGDGVKPTNTQANTQANTQMSSPNTSAPTNNSAATNRPTNTANNSNTINTSSFPNTSSRPVLKVNVLADNTANGWTPTGFVAKKGQKFIIRAKGSISLGKGNFSSPLGIPSLIDPKKLMPNEPTGKLIAVIGDDNNDFIAVGTLSEIVAKRDGMLFLGINEDVLDDNSGAFEVIIEVDPGGFK
jgi:hypothetical protein